MKYTIKHYLMNEEHCIVEVKDSQEACYWISIAKDTNTTQRLNLISEKEELVKTNKMKVKSFSNGELRFDDKFGKLILGPNGYILLNCSSEELPSDIDKLIISCLK